MHSFGLSWLANFYVRSEMGIYLLRMHFNIALMLFMFSSYSLFEDIVVLWFMPVKYTITNFFTFLDFLPDLAWKFTLSYLILVLNSQVKFWITQNLLSPDSNKSYLSFPAACFQWSNESLPLHLLSSVGLLNLDVSSYLCLDFISTSLPTVTTLLMFILIVF